MSYDPASGGPQQPQGWQGGQPPYPPPGGGYGQQPPAGWGPPPAAPTGGGGFGGPTGTPEQKNPLSALFDFSFTSFATPGLIKLLYVVGAALLVIAWLGYTIFGFAVQGAGLGILFLILGAVVVLFYLAFLRLILEFYFAVVRMSEDIHNRR